MPNPVLTEDEPELIELLLRSDQAVISAEMSERQVSELVIRRRMTGADALGKVGQVLHSMR